MSISKTHNLGQSHKLDSPNVWDWPSLWDWSRLSVLLTMFILKYFLLGTICWGMSCDSGNLYIFRC